MAADGLTFREFRGPEGVAACREDWVRILAALGGAHRFHHRPEWLEARLDALEPDPRVVHCLVGYDCGVPVGLIALKEEPLIRRGTTFRALVIPQSNTSTCVDCVVAPSQAGLSFLSQLVRYLQTQWSNWDVLHLSPLFNDSLALQALRASPPRWMAIDPVGYCNVLPCLPLDAMHARLSKNFRGNLRKARNKLRAVAHAFRSTRDPALLPAYVDAFIAVEGSGWKGTQGTGTAISTAAEQMTFFHSISRRLAAIGASEVSLLDIEGRCVAAQFSYVVAGTTHVAKIGYDETYARFAPGQMLMEDLILRSAHEGRMLINLGSDAKWHDDWKPERLPVRGVYMFNRTPKGLLALAGWKALELRRSSIADADGSQDTEPPDGG